MFGKDDFYPEVYWEVITWECGFRVIFNVFTMFCARLFVITISISAYLVGVYGGPTACQSALVIVCSGDVSNLDEM